MSKLIIVESPTKAKTLGRFLGDGFKIISSYGHIRDLPKSKMGINIDKNFSPDYVIPTDKEPQVKIIKQESKKATEVILATDPDREGEAIAWHLNFILGDKKDPKRIVFHEITEGAIKDALDHPRKLDLHLVDAQQARRVLDRLVGYKLSPLLWKKVKIGLSAGRVQSVTVKLVVEREAEIDAFKAQEYWQIAGIFSKLKDEKSAFAAFLMFRNGQKLVIKGQDDKGFSLTSDKEAKDVLKELEKAKYEVVKVEKKEVHKNPYPPFTTSTMNQAAANRFGFTAKRTMKIAQDLYEEGLITYHRTDSLNVAMTAVSQVREHIIDSYGKSYLSATPRTFKTKDKNAQEAHEAIRPAKVSVTPSEVKVGKDHKRLYELIWQRFVASQMTEAVYDRTSVDINSDTKTVYTFRANGSTIKFAGWLKVYGLDAFEKPTAVNADDDVEDEDRLLPELAEKEKVNLDELKPEQKFTQPPPRYTEASLIKKLEELGIGRPSTYAPTISTIQDRRYVEKDQRNFLPTPLGKAVTEFLAKNFPDEMDYNFTAELEDELDDIADGKLEWTTVMKKFYGPFNTHLSKVEKEADRVKVIAEKVDEKCDEGHQMVVRYGPFGKFLACEKYPEHKFTRPFATEEMQEKEDQVEKLDWKCPLSGDDIVVKRTRRGRVFYGCSAYPKCKFASWTKPGDEGYEAETAARKNGTYGKGKKGSKKKINTKPKRVVKRRKKAAKS